jgi:hypothetical protein
MKNTMDDLLEACNELETDGGKHFFKKLRHSDIYIYDLFSKLEYLGKKSIAKKLIYMAILTGYLSEG